MLSFMIEAQ